MLRLAGSADWALKIHALLLGHFHQLKLTEGVGPIYPGYLLAKLDLWKAGLLVLDSLNSKEYYWLKDSANAQDHANKLCVEDVT